MREAVAGLAMLVVGASGCTDVCGSPDQLNGRTFAGFATPRTFAIEGEVEAFPAASSPANGPVDVRFDWATDLPQGPLSVSLDGQAFEGSGRWSQVNCGTYTASFGGDYLGDDGAEHSFVAAGYFVQYDARLEGFVSWEERWETADGASGTYDSEVLLRGEEIGG